MTRPLPLSESRPAGAETRQPSVTEETAAHGEPAAPTLIPHPLADFKFCPHCGAEAFAENDPYSKRCAACGFVFYPNAAAATAAFILNERGELLCVRRKCEPARGTLDLPGGFVNPGESITDGLIREVKEEVGAEITHFEFLFSVPNTYPFAGHLVHTADAFFRCTVADPTHVTARDDAASAVWIHPQHLDPAAFGLRSVSNAVARFLARLPESP